MSFLPDMIAQSFAGGNSADNDYHVEVARGRIRGTSFFNFRAIGTCSGSLQELWRAGGAYTFPTSASLIYVSSSDAADVAGGAGARSVLIDGLDANYTRRIEIVPLNGTSLTPTSGQFIRVNRVLVSGSGQHGANRGNINSYHNGTLLISQIPSGSGRDGLGIFTVPDGTYAFIQNVTAFSGFDASARFRLMVRPGGTGSAFQEIADVEVRQAQFQISLGPSRTLPPRTDVKVSCAVTRQDQ